jgi:hypothetical protein
MIEIVGNDRNDVAGEESWPAFKPTVEEGGDATASLKELMKNDFFSRLLDSKQLTN